MAGGSKKKGQKMSWQEMQAQFGDKSRNPLDNLPTSSRSNSEHPRESFRSSMYERERRERREDRDEAPSRADESNAWRSSNASSSASSYRTSADRLGRSDDGMWRSSRPATASSFSSYSRRDDLNREPDATGRPRLNLTRPSADRLAAAQEQQLAAKASLADERSATKPSPFGDAKPVSSSRANPFGDVKPAEKTAEPWRPRSVRPSESDSRPEPSSRFARPVDTPPVRPREDPAPVRITPSLPPRKAPEAKPIEAAPARSPSPAKSAPSEPEPPCPVRSALEVSMAEGTWVTADELADCIGQVSLQTDEALDALGNVIALSLAHKTVLLPSAVTLIPNEYLPAVLQRSLSQLVQKVPADQIEDIVADVNVVEALGIDAKSLDRDQIVQRLAAIGLQQFAPKEDVAAAFQALCDQSASNDQLLAELKKRFPRKSKVPVDVACVVSAFIIRNSLSSAAFSPSTLEQFHDTLTFITATVKTQTYVLFGVQEAWFALGTAIKRSGKAIFEALYEMRLISVDAMVAWMHDKERSNGKRQLLLQCGGYISDLQNSAIAHQFENSDSEDSVDLDSDFPQANRNYDDY